MEHESLCVNVPEYVIAELGCYVVLHSVSFNCLFNLKCLSRAEREASSEHVEQTFLHMKALILAPVQQNTSIREMVCKYTQRAISIYTPQHSPLLLTCIRCTCSSGICHFQKSGHD